MLAYARLVIEDAPPRAELAELVAIVKRLLGEGGCPWDREQTLASLQPYLIEECYEVIEAIDSGAPAEHCEELGDLLFQIVFQSELRASEEAFSLADVIAAIAGKLRRRHPHVFAGAKAASADEVAAQWEAIKAAERDARGEPRRKTLDGIPAALPALSRAQRLSRRVGAVGFEWPDVGGCLAKVREETGEVETAHLSGDAAAIEEELGDLLFAVVATAQKLGVDAERALRAANRKFQARFEALEDTLERRGTTPAESTLEEMDAIWNQAKRAKGE